MKYSELMASLQPGHEGNWQTTVPENWMQGRTSYGGLTAALCCQAARKLAPEATLRSAQIAFVGPVGGDIELQPRVLRQGKNTIFVSVDLTVDGAVAAQSIMTFGAARQSKLAFNDIKMPVRPHPDECEEYFSVGRKPNFADHFNYRLASGERSFSGTQNPTIQMWLQNKDEDAICDATFALAMADCPPPAALAMLPDPAPVSAMTWMAEFLTDDFVSEDGWYLADSTAEMAKDGYTSQAMTLWKSDGTPVLAERQTITVFG